MMLLRRSLLCLLASILTMVTVGCGDSKMRRRVAEMDTETLNRLSKDYPVDSMAWRLIAEELSRRPRKPVESARKADPSTPPAETKPTSDLSQRQGDTNRAEAKEKFKKWAMDNLAVTDIAINSNTLFVTLTSDKYTSKANVEEIAQTIARYYCLQTKEKYAVCRVFIGEKLYAKGTYAQ